MSEPDDEWQTWMTSETIHDGPGWALIAAVPLLGLVLIAATVLVLVAR